MKHAESVLLASCTAASGAMRHAGCRPKCFMALAAMQQFEYMPPGATFQKTSAILFEFTYNVRRATLLRFTGNRVHGVTGYCTVDGIEVLEHLDQLRDHEKTVDLVSHIRYAHVAATVIHCCKR